MHADHGKTKKKFADKVPITDGIDAILANVRKTEVVRDAFAIQNNCGSGERSRSKWKNVCSREAITKPVRVALKSLHLPKQMVRKRDWLRALQMRVAGHSDVNVSLRNVEQGALQTSQATRHLRDLGFCIKPQI